jgi:hypothetical protein
LIGHSETPGDHTELGKVLPFLLQEADRILNKTDPWSAEETAFIEYITRTISEQRKAAAEQALEKVNAWKLQQKVNDETVGARSLFANQGVPPQDLLDQARAGIALTDDKVAAFEATLLAAASVEQSLDPKAAASIAGTVAATVILGAVAVAGTVISTVTIAAGSVPGVVGAGLLLGNFAKGAGATVAGGSGIAAGMVAIIVALVVSGIKVGVEIVQETEYDNSMATALADARKPTTADDLRTMLSTKEGQQQAFFYMGAQVAQSSQIRGK